MDGGSRQRRLHLHPTHHAARLGRAIGLALVAFTLALGPVLAAEAGAPAGANAAGPKVKLLVGFERRPGAAALGRLEAAGATIRRRFKLVPAVAVEIPAKAAAALAKQPGVTHVEADGQLRAFDHAADTGDLEYENAWGVEHIGVPAAHAAGIDGTDVKVGVIDTGIDYIHDDPDNDPYVVDPEFTSNYVPDGIDIFNGDDDPYDDNGHGTHVAGILAAERNGYLVSGVAPGVDLYAIKILNAAGEGEYSHLIAGIEWAVANGMDVVNMSVGGHEVSATLAATVAAAHAQGLTMVAASGNVNPFVWEELLYGCPVAYPAAYPQVLSTTFTNENDALTGWSCTGPEVDVTAPGDLIYSPVPIGSCMFCAPEGFSAQSGTSMASPHLAGVVALLIDAGLTDPDANGLLDDARDVICDTANTAFGVLSTPIPRNDPRYPKYFGCGVIDAGAAVESLVGAPPPPPPPANVAPTPVADSATTPEDTAVTTSVLANDTDPNGDTLTLVSVGAAANGTAVANANGTVTYTPNPGWSGSDSFGYTVGDGALTATSTVSVTVTAVNDPPTASAVNAATTAPASVGITLQGGDPDTCDLDFLIAALPAGGSIGGLTNAACTPGGSANSDTATLTYTPNASFSGADTFTYRVSDGTTTSAAATVTIQVTAAPPPPPPAASHHVGDLDGTSAAAGKTWTATVTVVVHDSGHLPVAAATVTGSWSGAGSGTGSCVTTATGSCTITKTGLLKRTATAIFTVTAVGLAGSTYDAAANHDPDGSSTGTAITIRRP